MSAGHPSRRFARHAIVGAAWAGCMLLSGAKRDPEFMQFDATARRVDLLIVAAYTKVNSGFNFNGGWNGSHRITIPVGWTLCNPLQRALGRSTVQIERQGPDVPSGFEVRKGQMLIVFPGEALDVIPASIGKISFAPILGVDKQDPIEIAFTVVLLNRARDQ